MREDILAFLAREDYKPLKLAALADNMHVTTADFPRLCETVENLVKEGVVVVNRKGRIGLTRQMGLLAGAIEGHAKGFAFFLPDDRDQRDIYIGFDYLNGALHGDRVLVRVTREQNYVNGRDEGEVVHILRRANRRVVGVFEAGSMWNFVRPDDRRLFQDILVSRQAGGAARDGDRVVVEYTQWPTAHRSPEGKIIEVLGPKEDAATDMLAVMRKHSLPEKFPIKVEKNSREVAKIEEADYRDRRDLRGERVITIDGADARDLDDAISLDKLSNGHLRLGVHIADVAHYVQQGSPLDREAWSRGTSVYLPDRVIPMLPPALSNHICSLQPQVDRLTLSCLMEIDERGQVVQSEIVESVINSQARLTYDDVNAVLDGDGELTVRYAAWRELFFDLDDLRQRLLGKREKRGALTFDFPEAKVLCDDDGEVLAIQRRLHGRAEGIIEECMIVANETVAGEYFYRNIPFVYRVHEAPSDEKLLALKEYVASFGYRLRGNLAAIKPKAFQQLLREVASAPTAFMLQVAILRAMSHAHYDTENRGHFGLASNCYCHFTAPIRRYPDLVIHRVIKRLMRETSLNEKQSERLYHTLNEAANHSSLRERMAEEAEREAVEIKKARYMADHIGEVYAGIIVNVTAYGFFVELANTVNGLVHVSSLEDDFYEYHETRHYLLGTHGGHRFALGDSVTVQVVRVNIDEHLIDFELADVSGDEVMRDGSK